jgi:hypothetical protein
VRIGLQFRSAVDCPPLLSKVTIMSNVQVPAGSVMTSTQAPALPDLGGLPDRAPITNGMSALYSGSDAAHAAIGSHGLQSGQYFVVSAKKNNTKGAGVEDGWQVHCVVPSFASDIATLGEWADLVNSVLLKQASESLKQFRASNPMASEIPVNLFTASQLREDYLAGGDSGSMTKEELERAFCASATWKRISTSDKFKTMQQYRSVAELFKQRVLMLAGRSHGSITDGDLDKILAKIEEDDFSTQFGAFVIRKIQQIKKNREEAGNEIDIDAL